MAVLVLCVLLIDSSYKTKGSTLIVQSSTRISSSQGYWLRRIQGREVNSVVSKQIHTSIKSQEAQCILMYHSYYI
jgi:hypothetical protein